MDDPTHCDPQRDTTLFLGVRAQARGHQCFYLPPSHLTWDRAQVRAEVYPVSYAADGAATTGAGEVCDLESFDVILIRQDPPFDMAYITTTYLLEMLRHPLVLNRPSSVRSFSEKLLALHFPELIPPTIVTRDPDTIRQFQAAHQSIVLKPLYGNGGAGVFIHKQGDPNVETAMEVLLSMDRAPIVAQAFLSAVRSGDKRVILIDGEVAGAINRIPTGDSLRANMHVGGVAEACALSARDHEICQSLQHFLRSQGLFLVGIDIIGGMLTEVNVTSPTGLQELFELSNIDAAQMFWDRVALCLSQPRA